MESLYRHQTPNFSVVRQMLGIGHSPKRGLIPRMPAKAAPPKDLGFFYGAKLTGLLPKVVRLNRRLGKKDTQHCTPCMGSGLLARDQNSQEESGGTRLLMNESLRHAWSGNATFAYLGQRWRIPPLGIPMPNKDQAIATKAAEKITGKRFCNNCRIYQQIDGGFWIASANGMRRRWKCAGCICRAKERLQTIC